MFSKLSRQIISKHLIRFDVTRSATFDAVIKWKQDLDAKVQLPDGSPIPCILLANKVKFLSNFINFQFLKFNFGLIYLV